jgi:hypothetical protein
MFAAAMSAAIRGCAVNSWLLTWYFIPNPPVCRSVLNRVDGVNEKNGSGIGGELSSEGSDESNEKAIKINNGSSWRRTEPGCGSA